MTLLSIVLFGRRIFRRAQAVHESHCLGIDRVKYFHQAEVDKEGLPVRCNKNVSRFDVTMHYAMTVDVFQG